MNAATAVRAMVSVGMSAALLIMPRGVVAQDRATVTLAPAYQTWSFKTALQQDTLAISRVSQTVLPVAAVVPLGDRWTASVAAAYARGTIDVQGGGQLSLDGLTDVRLRLTGSMAGDHLLLTAGVTVPTGKKALAGDELTAQRVIGAPVLRFAVPALGTGFGATIGAVAARRAGDWGLAVGTSFEMRGTYQPIEVAITGASVTTDLNPGDAVHVSLGADRLVGQNRLSLIVVGDFYTDDKLTAGTGATHRTSTYHVGPTAMAGARVDVAARNFRELTVQAQARYRSSFTDVESQTVPGSSGTAGDASVHAVYGRPGALGVIFGADATIDSGLEVDNSLATAGATGLGATLGLSMPMGHGFLEPVFRAQLGHIDTGPVSTSATSFTLGVSFVLR